MGSFVRNLLPVMFSSKQDSRGEVDTLETQLNHAMEQLPFSNYGYEAINQP